MKLPTDAVRPSDITDLMRRHMQYKNGTSYIQVHPTFLYESLWCLMVLFIMLLYRRHKKFNGEVFLVYLFGYGLGPVWVGHIRADALSLRSAPLPHRRSWQRLLCFLRHRFLYSGLPAKKKWKLTRLTRK